MSESVGNLLTKPVSIYLANIYSNEGKSNSEVVVRRCSEKKVFCEKYVLFLSLLSNITLQAVAGLRTATLLKKRFQHRCFPANFVKFQEHLFYRITPVTAWIYSVSTHSKSMIKTRKQCACKLFWSFYCWLWTNSYPLGTVLFVNSVDFAYFWFFLQVYITKLNKK